MEGITTALDQGYQEEAVALRKRLHR
jgi:hypothetical protein